MESKEWDSMTRHRGLFLALGLSALIGSAAPEARAAGITMTLTWTGGSITLNSLTSSPYVENTSTATALNINAGALSGYLSGHGSAITFTSLGASSNYPGGTPNPLVATLTESGTAVLSGSSGATAITVATMESGYTTPSGTTGTLGSAQTAIFTNVTAGGSEASSSSYNSTNTTTLTSTSTGTSLNAYSPTNSMGVGTIVSGYTLDNSSAISMTGSTPGAGTTTQFAVAATLTGAAVPEPASLIMMLTGMPLPLVVLGLLRRRRAAA
jgi:hypothetical protein